MTKYMMSEAKVVTFSYQDVHIDIQHWATTFTSFGVIQTN